MKLLLEISDAKENSKPFPKKFDERKASRAILFNSEGKIALLYMKKYDLYKLPGGGIEGNEEILKALEREIKEEIGCSFVIIKEVGSIIEYRHEQKLKQTSYCYIAKIKGPIGKPSFTEKEKEAETRVIWTNINEAINLFEQSSPKGSGAQMISKRDLAFIQETKARLKIK